MIPPLAAILIVPAAATVILALLPSYRIGAVVNVLASALTFLASVMLLTERFRTDILIVDDFNSTMLTLTAFIAFTTSIFSAGYMAHELASGRLTLGLIRFYHALYQATIGALVVAFVANNIGLMWVGVEAATLTTVMLVGLTRTPEAVAAARQYFILGSVGTALAFFGVILVYIAAQDVLGEGLPAMAWDLIAQNASKLDPKMLSLAFIFLLVGFGTTMGLTPFHGWLPDAQAEAPTPVAAILSGLLLNVGLYALLRFKMVMAGHPATIDVGAIMVALGLVSLVFAAFMLYPRRDLKRLFAFSSIGHIGIMTFAFGMGGALANFAGLLHMAMHALAKSAILFAVGHLIQVKGTRRIADISGLSVSHPLLAVGLALGVLAIAGLPPFGLFASEFLLVSSSFARQPWLTAILAAGLLVAFGALMLRMQGMLFGAPSGPSQPLRATLLPLFAHLLVVLIAGLWLPDALVRWFRSVAGQLG